MSKIGGWNPTGFGERLRSLREAAGLSQQELADKAGCNKFTISKTERGNQEPAWPLVLSLCAALNVTCEAFTMTLQAEVAEKPKPKRGRPAKQVVAPQVGEQPAPVEQPKKTSKKGVQS